MAREYNLSEKELKGVITNIKERYDFKEFEKTDKMIHLIIFRIGGLGRHDIIGTRMDDRGPSTLYRKGPSDSPAYHQAICHIQRS